MGNIYAIDLYSDSPQIQVGDMHYLPYEDGYFEIVFSGGVLGYSDDPDRALHEIVRVLKPGGYIALAMGYTPINKINLKKTFLVDHDL